MAHGLALDHAAWASPWRERSLRDKGVLSLGLLGSALALPPIPGGAAVALARSLRCTVHWCVVPPSATLNGALSWSVRASLQARAARRSAALSAGLCATTPWLRHSASAKAAS